MGGGGHIMGHKWVLGCGLGISFSFMRIPLFPKMLSLFFFFSCVGMKARPSAKMLWAYLFCKNDYNTIGFLYTIKQTTKIKF